MYFVRKLIYTSIYYKYSLFLSYFNLYYSLKNFTVNYYIRIIINLYILLFYYYMNIQNNFLEKFLNIDPLKNYFNSSYIFYNYNNRNI